MIYLRDLTKMYASNYMPHDKYAHMHIETYSILSLEVTGGMILA